MRAIVFACAYGMLFRGHLEIREVEGGDGGSNIVAFRTVFIIATNLLP